MIEKEVDFKNFFRFLNLKTEYFVNKMISIFLFLLYLYWEKLILLYQYFQMSWKKNYAIAKADSLRATQLVIMESLQLGGEFLLIFMDLHRGRLKIAKVSAGKIDVEYPYCGQKYIFRVSVKKGPNKFLVKKICDEVDNDITDTIKPYLGPKEDWHGNQFTVQDFGCSAMDFTLVDDRVLHYDKELPLME